MKVTKSHIIEQLYADKDIAQAIGKMQPVDLQDDLRQEMFMVLCEMDEKKLMDMHEKGFLKFYLVRTMLSMIKSDRSTFFNKFRKQVEEWSVQYDSKEDEPYPMDEMIYKLNKSMDILHWYEKEIFKLYSESGMNIMELSRNTKIPYRSLSLTIKKVKTYLYYKVRNMTVQD
jgi:hypothetical protein